MFNKILYLLVICGFCTALHAQTNTVQLLKINELQKRISNPDTVYVVNFWATWCVPCVKELPSFDKLQAAYKGQPLKVILVSLDFKSKLDKAVRPFVKNHQMKTEVYLADRANDQEFIDKVDKNWSGALPATLIVNGRKKTRNFYEKEFSYDELNKLYQTNK
jgi:thiol-disulfide isomerase/thioredoxin